tara:strand:+ start:628 stop:972 length:345 start_codon:yes stop_codon:yes gene_type:complete
MIMPKEEWGVKRVCPSCSIRFYDLKKDPLICPSCGHEFSLESLLGSKSRTMEADKPDAQNKENEVVEDDAEIVLEDDVEVEIEDDLLEEDGILEDDDDQSVSLEEIADVPAEEE